MKVEFLTISLIFVLLLLVSLNRLSSALLSAGRLLVDAIPSFPVGLVPSGGRGLTFLVHLEHVCAVRV